MKCPLCKHTGIPFHTYEDRNYLQCSYCESVFLETQDLPHPKAEKERYDLHHNRMDDEGYIEFLKPVIKAVLNENSPEDSGLDFGSGPNPVLTKLLQEKGFSIAGYDPIYRHSESVFRCKYDYITCCEVIEHFHQPAEEFDTLRELLKEEGKLYCKTSLYNNSIDFNEWYYKNDFTHSFFYTIKALEYIQQEWDFQSLVIESELITFKV